MLARTVAAVLMIGISGAYVLSLRFESSDEISYGEKLFRKGVVFSVAFTFLWVATGYFVGSEAVTSLLLGKFTVNSVGRTLLYTAAVGCFIGVNGDLFTEVAALLNEDEDERKWGTEWKWENDEVEVEVEIEERER